MLTLQQLKCNMLQYIIVLYKALTGASDMISNIEGGVYLTKIRYKPSTHILLCYIQYINYYTAPQSSDVIN